MLMDCQSDAVAEDAVCMETSFGVETVEPRTHVFHSTQSEDQLGVPLIPGFFIDYTFLLVMVDLSSCFAFIFIF